MTKITEMTAGSTPDGTELLEASQHSSSVTMTETTISALASDNSFNDSGSGFVTAGFAEGDTVVVSGFTESANNLTTGVITALTAGKMTIGGTDGDGITDEVAGDSVTISKWVTVRLAYPIVPAIAYDLPLSYAGGPPTSSEVISAMVVPRAVDLPADFAGSYGYIGTNPTSSFVISVKDDGTEIGTITVSTGGVFTFATTSNTAKSIAAGSRLEFVAPASADATAAYILATLAGVVA